MIYKAILVIQSVDIILNINEMYTNPLFVQCPHVTNMTNAMESGHHQYEGKMLLDGPIYQMYLYCIYYNRFVQNTGHLQRDAKIIRRVGTLEFSE